jgi:hypothetical protein
MRERFGKLVWMPGCLLLLGLVSLSGSAQGTPLLRALVLDGSAEPARELAFECASAETAVAGAVTLRNPGPEAALLVFGDGSTSILEAGEGITLAGADLLASTHRCLCECTCSGEGFSKIITFPCSSTTGEDKCPTANDSACEVLLPNADGKLELKKGKLSGCSRIYSPVA